MILGNYFSKNNRETSQPDITSWENLGFDPVPTDYMDIMKCSEGGSFKDGGLQRFGNIELVPSACVLNYGQVSYLKCMSIYFRNQNCASSTRDTFQAYEAKVVCLN